MSKTDRLLETFPAVYRALDQDKLLYAVVLSLAAPLEEMDTHLMRIQRAHRLKVAENHTDLIRLAAALNLGANHFEDILALKDLDYAFRLELIRQRIQRLARLHLLGLGTPWAVLEAAAIFLNSDIVAGHNGDSLVSHLDPQGYSHQVLLRSQLAGALPAGPGPGSQSESGTASPEPATPAERILLHENPLRRQRLDPEPRYPYEQWRLDNQNVEASATRFAIQGIEDRTVLPQIYCLETGQGFLFLGVVPAGSTLTVDSQQGARLDGLPVDDWLVTFQGAVMDYGQAGSGAFISEQGGANQIPFNGELSGLVNAPWSPRRQPPAAPVGPSNWLFKVQLGVIESSQWDFAVFETPDQPVGVFDQDFTYDGSLYDYPPSANAGLAWDGRIPCAIKLILPVGSGPDGAPGATTGVQDPTARLAPLLGRFKAAGIRAYLETGKDAWILGETRLRSAEAANGPGAAFRQARLWDPQSDLYVVEAQT